jgi:hypothetical protein
MEALYDEAAAMDSAERARFIEEQCGGDEELRGVCGLALFTTI